MTIRDVLISASRRIAASESDTPWLDTWVLLSAVLGVRREQLFADYDESLSPADEAEFQKNVDRRVAGTPIAYITGSKEFYGLEFAVDERVLIPRPDTEILVEEVLRVIDREADLVSVHDCCTGSGCIAVALSHERENLDVSASDVSDDALYLAQANAERLLGRSLQFHQSDLLASVPGRFHVITANAPYLSSTETACLAAKGGQEPLLALEAGDDGLSVYRRLIPQAVDSLWKGGYLFVEIADNQGDEVGHLFESAGFDGVQDARDLGGRRRVCWGRTTVGIAWDEQ